MRDLLFTVAAVLVARSLLGCAKQDELESGGNAFESQESEDGRPKASCSRNLGVYSWDQRNWREPGTSELLEFMASGEVCGDVYVNVADYSSARELKDEGMLREFLLRARKLSATGVVYLTYGDVTERDERAVEDFVETFYRWAKRFNKDEVRRMAPLGISFDIEHFPAMTFERVLKMTQEVKQKLIRSGSWQKDDLIVQCTIEGAYKPVDTDIIMKHADRALMMVYRNSLGESNDLMSRLTWFLTEQCEKCLDDAYARANYRAKLAIMVETACRVGNSCKVISFCAKTNIDGHSPSEYLFNTLREFEHRMVTSGLLSEEQKRRLFLNANESLFVVHHFEWFRCFLGASSGLCENFNTLADTCRSQ